MNPATTMARMLSLQTPIATVSNGMSMMANTTAFGQKVGG